MSVDPSQDEIDLTQTLAGELQKSVRNVEQHAKDGLKGGHSFIVGDIPSMKFYNDPVGHPEILDDILYDQYVLIRRTYAAYYLALNLGKNMPRSKQLLENANLLLTKLKNDVLNLSISGTESGLEGAGAGGSTVKTKPQSYPNNPNAERYRPLTVR